MSEFNIAEWLTALTGLGAVGYAGWEYRRQRRHGQLLLAQQLMERLEDDPLLLFATTTLDWGAGRVLIPELWRDAVGASNVEFDLDAIRDALKPNLTMSTATSPLRLLYRHAFVRLFNHLERMGTLRETGAIDSADLGPLAEMAHELSAWRYGGASPHNQLFMVAMEAWCPRRAPQKLIACITRDFPAPPPEPSI